MATFTVNVAEKANEPPTIGDGLRSTDHNVQITLTRADFTTNTTPAYSDPEGDAPLTLKITSLPAEGTLRLNGVDVTVNQEINFTTEIDAGLLTYSPNSGNLTSHSVNFNFEIADAGSNIFVS